MEQSPTTALLPNGGQEATRRQQQPTTSHRFVGGGGCLVKYALASPQEDDAACRQAERKGRTVSPQDGPVSSSLRGMDSS